MPACTLCGMATDKQIATNRENAKKSTGPRTDAGKAASSRNALFHGLTANEFFVLKEQEPLFEKYSSGLLADIRPEGALEMDVFIQLVHAGWTLHRCRLAEIESYNNSDIDGETLLTWENEADLERIENYTRRSERAYHRALKELRALQTERAFRRSIEPSNVDRVEESPLIAFRSFLPKPKPLSKPLPPLKGIENEPEPTDRAA